MMTEEDAHTFPWHIVDTVTFQKEQNSFVIMFKSGHGLNAKCQDEQTFDQFIRESTLNLGCSKVCFI